MGPGHPVETLTTKTEIKPKGWERRRRQKETRTLRKQKTPGGEDSSGEGTVNNRQWERWHIDERRTGRPEKGRVVQTTRKNPGDLKHIRKTKPKISWKSRKKLFEETSQKVEQLKTKRQIERLKIGRRGTRIKGPTQKAQDLTGSCYGTHEMEAKWDYCKLKDQEEKISQKRGAGIFTMKALPSSQAAPRRDPHCSLTP